ncbi:MAG: DUF2795 domain-containing protein [Actinomycetota bacterium]
MNNSTAIGITRSDVARALEDAFQSGPANRDDLVVSARSRGAAPEVIEVLEGLPNRSFRRLRELWEELPKMPIGEF